MFLNTTKTTIGIFALPLTLFLMTVIAGCGGSEQSVSAPATAQPTATATAMPAPTPTPAEAAVSSTTTSTESPEISWTTVVDEHEIFSISLPAEWETTTDLDQLLEENPRISAMGAVIYLRSEDPSANGANIIAMADFSHVLSDPPLVLEPETYFESVIERIKIDHQPETIDIQPININGINGIQIRMSVNTVKTRNITFNHIQTILVGAKDDVRMMCGQISMIFHSVYLPDFPIDVSILEKAMESVQILPTAAGDMESCDEVVPTQETEKGLVSGQLELLDWDWGVDQYGDRALVGSVVNNSEYTQTSICLTFTVSDKDGYKIEDPLACVDSLRPGEKWKFAAPVFEEAGYSAEPIELIGYPDTTTQTTDQQNTGQLELLEWEVGVDQYGDTALVGVVANNSNYTQTSICLTFAVFDKDGYKIEDPLACVDSLRPGEKWKFAAPVFEEAAYSAEPVELIGYPE